MEVLLLGLNFGVTSFHIVCLYCVCVTGLLFLYGEKLEYVASEATR